LRIAVVQAELVWGGGIERFLSSVLKRLGRENRVAVFTFRYDPAALPRQEGFEIRVVRGRTDIGGRLRAYFDSARLGNLLNELTNWKPDVVIVQQLDAIRLANWLSLRMNGVPVIPYLHDIWTLSMISKFEASEEERRRKESLGETYRAFVSSGIFRSRELGQARPVACVSHFIQDNVSEFWKGVETRVIYNGVDHNYFFPTWEDEGFALCVSRIDKSKNLDLILDSFQGATYPVVICGNVLKGNLHSEEFSQELLSRAKHLIQVRLDPDEAMVRRLIQKSSILLQPGKNEGFGLVPLEAMACGKPVIAHKSGGAIEVVDGGGILLGDDGSEWKRVADELMASPGARRELGKKALEHSMKFDWDKTAAEIMAMCKDASATNRLVPHIPANMLPKPREESIAAPPHPGKLGAGSRFAFMFSKLVAYPPNIHDIKCYYVSKELVGRGDRVVWIQLGKKRSRSSADGIRFITIPSFKASPFTDFASMAQMVFYCLAGRVQVAYIDEWLFDREKPTKRLALAVGLKIAGVRTVLDERDPFIDFEVASGWIPADSSRLQRLRSRQRILQRLSNLLILPSRAYSDLLASEGVPQEKLLGTFRGIDTDLFTANQDSVQLKANLGLSDKFVIGWFGLMHPYRLIREVIIPIIEDIDRVIPNAHVVIGGEGPLRAEFESLSRQGGLPLSLVGMVAYDRLPGYISTCDVLLCPVDNQFRFSNHSAWLKIAESLAVGRPVIASRTMIAEKDFKDLKGVVWVPPTLEGFMKGLKEVHDRYPDYLSLAREQSTDFENYSTKKTLAVIADRLEAVADTRVRN
jgi:glycosyltransferase involved in cell wall biosynthesis